MPVIRPARQADEATLLGMLHLLADFPVPDWRTARQIADADLRILLEALHHPDPRSSILVAEDVPGSVAGFVFTTTRQDYFTGKLHAHIEVLTVLGPAQGRGVARALVDAAETWALGQGYSHVTLNVFANNSRARAVYERLGYMAELVHYLKRLEPRDSPGKEGQ
jgi:ribosomal protein S18 acetylase RimI-like enzyme